VTAFLIVAGIATVIYGGFQYYQEKASVMENELESKERSFTGNSLDSPGLNPVNIEQKTRLTDEEEVVAESDISDSAKRLVVEPEPEAEVSQQMAKNEHRQDSIEFFAEKGSWMEVRDANNRRLFYNMVPEGGTKVLQGQAPFRVSLGNAKTTRVVINDLEVDMTDYIRPNNTAKFKVSSEEQNVIFY
jgi:cytoskeleton protein RodZ